jgi:hypothetical protein
MPILEAARCDLARRLELRHQGCWPEFVDLTIRYRGSFAYLDGTTADDDTLPLCRLRYLGTPHDWGFAIDLASEDGYEDSVLPRGTFTGAREEAPRLRMRSLLQRRHCVDRSTRQFARQLLTSTTKRPRE